MIYLTFEIGSRILRAIMHYSYFVLVVIICFYGSSKITLSSLDLNCSDIPKMVEPITFDLHIRFVNTCTEKVVLLL